MLMQFSISLEDQLYSSDVRKWDKKERSLSKWAEMNWDVFVLRQFVIWVLFPLH